MDQGTARERTKSRYDDAPTPSWLTICRTFKAIGSCILRRFGAREREEPASAGVWVGQGEFSEGDGDIEGQSLEKSEELRGKVGSISHYPGRRGGKWVLALGKWTTTTTSSEESKTGHGCYGSSQPSPHALTMIQYLE